MAIETYRLKICGDSLSYYWANVLHFIVDNNDDGSPYALASELVTAIAVKMADKWADFNAIGTVCHYIEAKRILPGGGNSCWKEFPSASLKGLINQQINSLSLAPIVKLYTSLSTGLQGRIFLPPPADTEVTENSIGTSYNNAVLDWVEDMQEFTEDHDWQLAVYSKKQNIASSVETAAMSPILGQLSRRRTPG